MEMILAVIGALVLLCIGLWIGHKSGYNAALERTFDRDEYGLIPSKPWPKPGECLINDTQPRYAAGDRVLIDLGVDGYAEDTIMEVGYLTDISGHVYRFRVTGVTGRWHREQLIVKKLLIAPIETAT